MSDSVQQQAAETAAPAKASALKFNPNAAAFVPGMGFSFTPSTTPAISSSSSNSNGSAILPNTAAGLHAPKPDKSSGGAGGKGKHHGNNSSNINHNNGKHSSGQRSRSGSHSSNGSSSKMGNQIPNQNPMMQQSMNGAVYSGMMYPPPQPGSMMHPNMMMGYPGYSNPGMNGYMIQPMNMQMGAMQPVPMHTGMMQGAAHYDYSPQGQYLAPQQGQAAVWDHYTGQYVHLPRPSPPISDQNIAVSTVAKGEKSEKTVKPTANGGIVNGVDTESSISALEIPPKKDAISAKPDKIDDAAAATLPEKETLPSLSSATTSQTTTTEPKTTTATTTTEPKTSTTTTAEAVAADPEPSKSVAASITTPSLGPSSSCTLPPSVPLSIPLTVTPSSVPPSVPLSVPLSIPLSLPAKEKETAAAAGAGDNASSSSSAQINGETAGESKDLGAMKDGKLRYDKKTLVSMYRSGTYFQPKALKDQFAELSEEPRLPFDEIHTRRILTMSYSRDHNNNNNNDGNSPNDRNSSSGPGGKFARVTSFGNMNNGGNGGGGAGKPSKSRGNRGGNGQNGGVPGADSFDDESSFYGQDGIDRMNSFGSFSNSNTPNPNGRFTPSPSPYSNNYGGGGGGRDRYNNNNNNHRGGGNRGNRDNNHKNDYELLVKEEDVPILEFKPIFKKIVDENDPDYIMRQANLILNKLSVTKFGKLSTEFMDSGIAKSPCLLRKAVETIVSKAQLEEHFCFMYADLCKKIMDVWKETPLEFSIPDIAASATKIPKKQAEKKENQEQNGAMVDGEKASLVGENVEAGGGGEEKKDGEKEGEKEEGEIEEEEIVTPAVAVAPENVTILEVSSSKGDFFRQVLLERCQAEFEVDRAKEVEAIRADSSLNDDERLEKELILKKRYTGHMTFIGEIYQKDIVTAKVMKQYCLDALIVCEGEEELTCMCKLFETVGAKLEQYYDDKAAEKARKSMKKSKSSKSVKAADDKGYGDVFTQYFDTILKLSKTHPVARVRFMMKDLYEMREKGWQARREKEKVVNLDEARGLTPAPEEGNKFSGDAGSQMGPPRTGSSTFLASSTGDARALATTTTEPAADEWEVVGSTTKNKRASLTSTAINTKENSVRGTGFGGRSGNPSSSASTPRGMSSRQKSEKTEKLGGGKDRKSTSSSALSSMGKSSSGGALSKSGSSRTSDKSRSGAGESGRDKSIGRHAPKAAEENGDSSAKSTSSSAPVRTFVGSDLTPEEGPFSDAIKRKIANTLAEFIGNGRGAKPDALEEAMLSLLELVHPRNLDQTVEVLISKSLESNNAEQRAAACELIVSMHRLPYPCPPPNSSNKLVKDDLKIEPSVALADEGRFLEPNTVRGGILAFLAGFDDLACDIPKVVPESAAIFASLIVYGVLPFSIFADIPEENDFSMSSKAAELILKTVGYLLAPSLALFATDKADAMDLEKVKTMLQGSKVQLSPFVFPARDQTLEDAVGELADKNGIPREFAALIQGSSA